MKLFLNMINILVCFLIKLFYNFLNKLNSIELRSGKFVKVAFLLLISVFPVV